MKFGLTLGTINITLTIQQGEMYEHQRASVEQRYAGKSKIDLARLSRKRLEI